LGERLLCKQEVVGSIPSGSTSNPIAVSHALKRIGANQNQIRSQNSEQTSQEISAADFCFLILAGLFGRRLTS
jgi:hypothetical protein